MVSSTTAVIFHILAARVAKGSKNKDKLAKYRQNARMLTTVSILLLGIAYVLAWNKITNPSKHDVKINAVHLMMILLPATLLELYIANRELAPA